MPGPGLLNTLYNARDALATRAGLPVEAICPDDALARIVLGAPSSAQALEVYARGSVHAAFLATVRDVLDAHHAEAKGRSWFMARPAHVQICEAYNAGATLPDLLLAEDIDLETFLKHAHTYLNEGGWVRPEGIVAQCTLEAARVEEVRAFYRSGQASTIETVHAHFGRSIGYDDLRIVGLGMRLEKRKRPNHTLRHDTAEDNDDDLAKHGLRWTREEDVLLAERAATHSVAQLAALHQRSVRAVRLRMLMLGLSEIDPPTPRGAPRWTEEAERQLAELADEGADLDTIAARMDRSPRDVRRQLERVEVKRRLMGLPLAHGAWSSEDDDTLWQLYTRGRNVSDIAVALRRSPMGVRKRFEVLEFLRANAGQQPWRAGKRWTEADMTQLVALHDAGTTPLQAALEMQQSAIAVRSRLRALGFTGISTMAIDEREELLEQALANVGPPRAQLLLAAFALEGGFESREDLERASEADPSRISTLLSSITSQLRRTLDTPSYRLWNRQGDGYWLEAGRLAVLRRLHPLSADEVAHPPHLHVPDAGPLEPERAGTIEDALAMLDSSADAVALLGALAGAERFADTAALGEAAALTPRALLYAMAAVRRALRERCPDVALWRFAPGGQLEVATEHREVLALHLEKRRTMTPRHTTSGSIDWVDYYDAEVVPALFDKLDRVFPEFGWRRLSQGWRATDGAFTRARFGARPQRLQAYHDAPYGFTIHGDTFVTWLAYLHEGVHPTGAAYVEAVLELAERAGIDTMAVERERTPEQRARARRGELLDAYVRCARTHLREKPEIAAQLEVHRGFTADDLEASSIGYHDAALFKRLIKAGFTGAELDAWGHLRDARWNGRVVFPWRNHRGRINTIIGRTIPGSLDVHPKYLYMTGGRKPDLFGLDVALKSPLGRENLVIVEGLFDVMLCQARGMPNVAAVGGSGNLLNASRWARLGELGVQGVTLVMDRDDAGADGTLTALEKLANAKDAPLVQVLDPRHLAPYKDPDEMVREEGVEALQSVLERRVSAGLYHGARLLDGVTPTSPDYARRRALRKLTRYCERLQHDELRLVREDLIKHAAERTGYSTEALERYIAGGDHDANLTDHVILHPARLPQTPPPRWFDHQRRALKALEDELETRGADGRMCGVIDIPKDVGIADAVSAFLVDRVIDRMGLPVVWLAAHPDGARRAALALIAAASRARTREAVSVRVVAHGYATPEEIDPARDDIVVATHAQLKHPDHAALLDTMINDERSFFVIDDLPDYLGEYDLALLDRLGAVEARRLLGLSSNPLGGVARWREVLGRAYGDNILHHTSIASLIKDGHLASPSLTHVHTGVVVDQSLEGISVDGLRRDTARHAAWRREVAQMHVRNEAIVQHFLRRRGRYGKTIIFALDPPHAAHITTLLREEGVAAEALLHHNAEGEPIVTAAIRERFVEGAVEVLIDPALHLESASIPNVQTVILAGPSLDEATLRARMGRAMIGPRQGGTATATIVSMEDRWLHLHQLASPFLLAPDLLAVSTQDAYSERHRKMCDLLPASVVQRVALRSRQSPLDQKADAFDEIPDGWFLLTGDDGSPEGSLLFVHWHQKPCWDALLDVLEVSNEEQLRFTLSRTAELHARYFGDCDTPAPAPDDVRRLLEHVSNTGERPTFRLCEDREAADPYGIARHIWDDNLNAHDAGRLIERRYTTQLARAVYDDLRTFRVAVEDALYELQYPFERTNRALGVPRFDLPTPPLASGHDLDDALTLARAACDALTGAPPRREVTITWTNNPMTAWLASAVAGTGNRPDVIRVNRVLDTPETPRAALDFLVWHQLLHLALHEDGHPPQLRDVERRWPGFEQAVATLETIAEGHRELLGALEW